MILEDFQPGPQPAPLPEETQHVGRFVRDIFETLVLAVLLFLGINAVSARVRVDGTSMRPTLEDGEFILVNRLAYRFGQVQRGDIIVFHYPQEPKEELIKRVIGLPEDEVRIAQGTVSINGEALAEQYIAAPPEYSGSWTVPEGYLFVLGDNRNNSSDSHQWGMLPMENVIGRALLIYWPPPMWSLLQHGNALAVAAQVSLR